MVVALPKPGKEPTSPKNFRPISLLNMDVKIYAKLLANGLENILPSLISQDHSGFTKGRQASDATRRMINVIHHIESTKMPSLLLFLEAEKAFDRVHWGYISAVLNQFGLTGQIHNAIMALYSNPSARVFSADTLSVPFQILNGTKQGCSLSPLILNLIMEPLAENIRSNIKISGIPIPGGEHKSNLFADDAILMITEPDRSLPEMLAWFGNISYYRVNETKSFILNLAMDISSSN